MALQPLVLVGASLVADHLEPRGEVAETVKLEVEALIQEAPLAGVRLQEEALLAEEPPEVERPDRVASPAPVASQSKPLHDKILKK